jgi:hypothetical protein
VVSDRPRLITLGASSQGFGVRIQAVGNETRPGSQYSVAFIHDGVDGLASAIDLARILREHKRVKESQEVLRLAEERFPRSPQVALVRRLQLEGGQLVSEQR